MSRPELLSIIIIFFAFHEICPFLISYLPPLSKLLEAILINATHFCVHISCLG